MIAEERRSRSEVVATEKLQSRITDLPPNNFDTIIAEIETEISPINEAATGWLEQWVKQSPSRMPSSKELQ